MRRTILIFVVLLFLTACVSETATTPAAIQASDTLSPTITYTPSLSSTPTSTLTPVSMPTPTESAPPKPVAPTLEKAPVSVNAEDPYTLNISVDQEQITSASDEELLTLAPVFPEGFDYTVYNFREEEITGLEQSEVVRLGENAYVVYKDGQERSKMWWNVEKGEIEHISESSYLDETTGLRVRSILITDNSWTGENNTWWELDERGEEVLSKAIFENLLTWNNQYTNHREDPGLPIRYSDLPPDISYQNLRAYQNQAISVLRSDISKNEGLEIDVKNRVKIEVEPDSDLVFALRVNNSNKWSNYGYYFYPFGDHQFIDVVSPDEKNVEVDINIDSKFLRTGKPYVGGFLVQTLRDMTVIDGYSVINPDNQIYTMRSLSDTLAIDLCGEDVVKRYLDGLRDIESKFADNWIVPHYDRINPRVTVPLCIVEAR